MDAWARGLHVLGVVLWIGGVAFVTLVLLPAVAHMKTVAERVAFFEVVEARFALVARYATLLVGATGFFLVKNWSLWERFTMVHFWWMHAMVGVWGVFAFVLFVAEPLFLHAWFRRQAQRNPDRAFARIRWAHWALLVASVVTVMGAFAGARGVAF